MEKPDNSEAVFPVLKSKTRQAGWRRANPLKYRAHLLVHRALGTGQLQKQPCEVCGAKAVDAHHDRYEEPLNVRWLCRRHHTKLHYYGEDMFPIGRTHDPANPEK
ncbi:MAG: hypothetical protein ACU0DH_05990 [Paracoccus sp. (in: a-proteobacteria)]|uniref:hypothetical protein n=1 Tax=Paracoccus sp. TaxID=267 RepID=UPI002E85DB38|nr:hypothetical protein [Pseudomonadota bacterium]